MEHKKKAAAPFLVLLFLVLLILFSKDCLEASRNGIDLCLTTAVPSLFPFFVVSTLSVELELTALLGQVFSSVMMRLFGLPGECASAVALGLSGGYPVGAQAACELYDSGICSKQETERLLGFCNNSGPAFIVGVCGAGIFGSLKAGLFLYAVHILCAMLVGIILRPSIPAAKHRRPVLLRQKNPIAKPPLETFTSAIKGGLLSCINVSAFIIFFSVVICICKKIGIFPLFSAVLTPVFYLLGLPSHVANSILTGAVEMTNGLGTLSPSSSNLVLLLPTAAFLLGFGGLSVHCQTLSLLLPKKLSARIYFIGKTLHGILSFALCRILIALFPACASVFSPLVLTSPPPAALSFLSFSLLLFLAIPTEILRNLWKKAEK